MGGMAGLGGMVWRGYVIDGGGYLDGGEKPPDSDDVLVKSLRVVYGEVISDCPWQDAD